MATSVALPPKQHRTRGPAGPLDLGAAIEAATKSYRELVERQARGELIDADRLGPALLALGKPLETFRRDVETLAERLRAAADLAENAAEVARMKALREESAMLECKESDLREKFRAALDEVRRRRQAVESQLIRIDGAIFHRFDRAQRLLQETADPELRAKIQAGRYALSDATHSVMMVRTEREQSPLLLANLSKQKESEEARLRAAQELLLDPVAAMAWAR